MKALAMISVQLLLLTIARTFSPRHTLRLLAVIHASQTYFPGGRLPKSCGTVVRGVSLFLISR